tara:strand:+ start:6731 stop:6979 length:249 start_codon:yes stop_codon:yes gene_type:complete
LILSLFDGIVNLFSGDPMHDQYVIEDGESKKDKWNRGLDIFIESVIKPDAALRQCAHNQRCYHELMDIRGDVLEYLKTKRWD